MNINELKARIERLESELKEARAALFAAEAAVCDIKIGDIYERKKRHGHGKNEKEITERGRVVRLGRTFAGDITGVLQLLKKDGSDGVRQTYMYQWDHWQRVTP